MKPLGALLTTVRHGMDVSCSSVLIENTNTLLDHVMEHHWTDAHPPTPETLIKQVTGNPERALQAGQHIPRTLCIQ